MKVSPLVVVAFTAMPVAAQADWAELSAAYLCSPAKRTFAIAPTLMISESEKLQLPRYFRPLPNGARRTLTCQLGKHRVTLRYMALPPRERGQCRGIGFTEISSLEIGRKRIMSNTEINSGCFFEATLISVKLEVTPTRVAIERCTATSWSWDGRHEGTVCTHESLEL